MRTGASESERLSGFDDSDASRPSAAALGPETDRSHSKFDDVWRASVMGKIRLWVNSQVLQTCFFFSCLSEYSRLMCGSFVQGLSWLAAMFADRDAIRRHAWCRTELKHCMSQAG